MKGEIRAKLKENWREMALCGVFPVALEVLLHLAVYGELTARIVYPCIFALTAGCGLFIASTLGRERVNRAVFLGLAGAMTLYFEVQFVYNSIFGEFMSFWQFSFGAEALTNFWQQMLYGIWEAVPEICLLLSPQLILCVAVLGGRSGLRFRKCPWRMQLSALGTLAALHLSVLGLMALNNNNAFSAYRLYQNPNTATEISVKNIGLLSTARLECKYLLLSGSSTSAAAGYSADGETVYLSASEMQKKNMLDIDFDAITEETDDETLKSLDAYFAQQEPTSKNQYTGLFRGYNLITICAESFSPYLIDEELTPALYELSTNGFVFENYFGSYGSNTTNGEYTFCVGLYPDLSRNKTMASFYASQNNYLPFCLGNEFKGQGASAWAYHNYTGDYYSRNATHPNMGYTFKAAGEGLDMELGWPTSDLEMMEKSVDDYIDSGEQFCAYYMTFSGHYQYNWENPMSLKNRSAVEDLPYSDTVKAYIACNLELEYAMEYLLARLEEAGIADQTVIVLTNDHYPYGLSETEYNQLAGRKVDTTFDKYRNSFICYVPDVRIPVETYCSTADILPTLLNLFGLPYDSRLLAGRDVLSAEADDYAVLSDQSFVTRDFGFDTSTGTVTYFSDGVDREQAEARLLEIQEEIADRFHVSADMLSSDYYAHAILGRMEGAGEVVSYTFEDITNSISIGMLDYIYGNGYMDPVSDTRFGFDEVCTYAELLDVLYRISGSPDVGEVDRVSVGGGTVSGAYAPAVCWARDNGLIDPAVASLSAATPLTRKSCAVTLRAYADYRGLDTGVDAAEVAACRERFPGFTDLEVEGVYWCFRQAVIRSDGTLESVFAAADSQMNRRQAVISVYNYHLYVLS